MKEKHLDINGKNIRIGDIVILHKVDRFLGPREVSTNKKNWDKSVRDINERIIGTAGIVIAFGCVTVECCSDRDEDQENCITRFAWFDDNEVEVIGNIR